MELYLHLFMCIRNAGSSVVISNEATTLVLNHWISPTKDTSVFGLDEYLPIGSKTIIELPRDTGEQSRGCGIVPKWRLQYSCSHVWTMSVPHVNNVLLIVAT